VAGAQPPALQVDNNNTITIPIPIPIPITTKVNDIS
jgi:hypothetical protein